MRIEHLLAVVEHKARINAGICYKVYAREIDEAITASHLLPLSDVFLSTASVWWCQALRRLNFHSICLLKYPSTLYFSPLVWLEGQSIVGFPCHVLRGDGRLVPIVSSFAISQRHPMSGDQVSKE
jgi:hypothetical protein